MSTERLKDRYYLNKLGVAGGIPLESTDKRRKKYRKERKKYGFDQRDTWNLSMTMIELLYERLCLYKKEASKHIQLDFHKFEYKGVEKTQLEMIDILLDKLKVKLVVEDYDLDKEMVLEKYAYTDDIWIIWAMLEPVMWW